MYINVKEQAIIKTHLKVAKVVDGDGIIVTNLFNKQEEEIRLLGIDAPELRMCRKLNQDERETHIAGQLLMELGRKAQKFMISVVPPETNITLIQEEQSQIDAYGRTLAYVYLPDGRCLNEIMIAEGFAKPYNRFFCSELPKYQLLSSTAKIKQKGLFSIVQNW
ncbi:thermonuclease family protein [Flavobacterium filum]|uniref:thermonuclease family protein n=1 Tax=Flavobacterium filum TaxID=370974 RepID=UPI0023F36226|nr:thermonuclease family protein [Flavobacterium filum]